MFYRFLIDLATDRLVLVQSFDIILSRRHLAKFVVVDVDMCDPRHNSSIRSGDGADAWGSKFALADVMVSRESDYGVNDEILMCVSHLGNLLQVKTTTN